MGCLDGNDTRRWILYNASSVAHGNDTVSSSNDRASPELHGVKRRRNGTPKVCDPARCPLIGRTVDSDYPTGDVRMRLPS